MYGIRVKEVLYCRSNTVYLSKGTNSEKTDSGSKECKNFRKPSPLFSHTILNIIKWSAKNVSVLVNSTVFNGQKSFCIFGCHSEECGNDHPEQGSGSAGSNSSGNTYDVTGSDSCGQSCAERTKACDFTFAAFFIFYHEFQCFSQMSYL